MIKRAVAVAVLLVLVYSVLVYFFQSKISRTGQSQYTGNVVKAEEFLFENGRNADHVIVGSSMASRLVADSLPEGYFNLAMGGMSLFDGLYLLNRSSFKPEVLLIEMNFIERGANEGLEGDVFHPLLNPMRTYVPVLRRKYQPISVAKALLRDASGLKPDAVVLTLPEHMFKQELGKVMERNGVALSDSIIDVRFNELSKYVSRLRAEGVQIVFFEMPIYDKAASLPKPTSVRTEFYRRFPPGKYKYINLPPDAYETRDGVHLGLAEASRYTRYFKKELSSMGLLTSK